MVIDFKILLLGILVYYVKIIDRKIIIVFRLMKNHYNPMA